MTDFQSRFGDKIGRMNSNGQVYNVASGKRISAMGRYVPTDGRREGSGGGRAIAGRPLLHICAAGHSLSVRRP